MASTYSLIVTVKYPPISFLIKYFKHNVERRHNYNKNLCIASHLGHILSTAIFVAELSRIEAQF